MENETGAPESALIETHREDNQFIVQYNYVFHSIKKIY